MADWLLIRIGNDPGTVDYLAADGTGRIIETLRTGSLADAAPHQAGRRVCVLAPASDVLLTDAESPLKSGARYQQIVPFALEEQLAEDIESLHFAVGRRVGDSPRIPVAVVSRALIDGWLNHLRDAASRRTVCMPTAAWFPKTQDRPCWCSAATASSSGPPTNHP